MYLSDVIRNRAFPKRMILAFAAFLCVGLGCDVFLTCVTSSVAFSQACPGEDGPDALKSMLEDPELFIGCSMTVEGILEKRETEDSRTVYFLKSRFGSSPEIWPWAPDENSRSEPLRKEQPPVKQMSYYVGRELRIMARLVQEMNGRVVLEASIIEELGAGKGASE